jgi:tetratricopeptide (TPR) repeat protein
MRRITTSAKSASPKTAAPAMAFARFPAWLLAGMLVLGTIAVYWPATQCDFVNYDDGVNVTANVQVRSGLSWGSIKWAFSSPLDTLWQPLTALSHMAVCQVSGLKPWGHHLANVLLHALNACLVFALLERMTGAVWRSLWVAALFVVHPLRVESVAWVSERRDVLSTLFGLLSLLAYAGYAQKTEDRGQRTAVKDPWSIFQLPASISYLLSLFFLALGLMSKPTLVTWPGVMLLLDFWPLRRTAKYGIRKAESGAGTTGRGRALFWLKLVWEKAPFFLLVALGCIVTVVVQQRTGAMATAQDLPWGARVGNALVSSCRYLGKLFWPAELAVFYPHPGYWPLGKVLLAGGLLLGLSMLVWLERRRYPYLLAGWLWYCGTLLPVSQMIQTGSQAMADRWTYLPSLGVLIMAVWGVCELTRRWRHQWLVLSAVGGAAVVFCLALTRRQISYWTDSEALFRHSLSATGDNDFARCNLAAALDQKGQSDEAIRQFQEIVSREPDQAQAQNNLGAALYKKGRIDEAIHHLQQAIRLKPDYADARRNLATALADKGQGDEAIHQYEEALRLKPDYAEVHNSLGLALSRKGQADEAIRHYQEALRLEPDYAEAHNSLGAALDDQGQSDEAIRRYQEALRLKPDYADAHYNLGNALGRRGQTDEAILHYQQAIRLKPDHAEAHNNLGIAFYHQGRLGEAIGQFQEALRLKPDFTGARRNLDVALAARARSAPPPGAATDR